MSGSRVVPDVLAAVDLGSNSFHMVVARLQHGQLVILDRLREMVRLGAGLSDSGRLDDEAMARALRCLERFGQRLRAMRAELTAAVVLEQRQYQASELLISAVMSGARFTERPVTMYARTSGRSKKGGNFSYGYRYGKVFVRTWWREVRRNR